MLSKLLDYRTLIAIVLNLIRFILSSSNSLARKKKSNSQSIYYLPTTSAKQIKNLNIFLINNLIKLLMNMCVSYFLFPSLYVNTQKAKTLKTNIIRQESSRIFLVPSVCYHLENLRDYLDG